MLARKHRWQWRMAAAGLVLALGLAGCATLSDQNIIDMNAAQRRHLDGILDPDSNKWNATDWTIWMTMNGGG